MNNIYKILCLGTFLVPGLLFAQKPEVTIKMTNAAITIDGEGTDAAWSAAPKIAIGKPYDAETVTGGSATFQMLYDAANIYVFVDVTDDVVTVDNSADWKGDKVEIYFGLPGYTPGQAANALHGRQLFGVASQNWADGTTPAHWVYNDESWTGSASRETDGVAIGYKETVTGYTYEFQINKSALEDVDFATIDSLGFDFTIADNDVVGDGLGVRNRLVYYNSGDQEFANENWNKLDLASLKFDVPVVNNLFMVKKAGGTITLDGKADEGTWKAVPATAIDKTYANESVTGGSAEFKMLYDADNIYVFVDVTDDVVTVDNSADWKGDKVEVYFGLPGYVPGTGASGAHARQFFGVASQDWADGTTPAHWTGYSVVDWPGIASRTTDGVAIGYNETLTGYSYEFQINKSALENVDFSTIDSLAFDFTLADNDIVGDGLGVRNRLVYYNTGDLQYANENWGAMDCAGLVFSSEIAVAVRTNKVSEQSAYIAYDMLKFKGYGKAVNVEIYSILGQKVISAKNVNEVNIANLVKGVYVVRVNGGKDVFKVMR